MIDSNRHYSGNSRRCHPRLRKDTRYADFWLHCERSGEYASMMAMSGRRFQIGFAALLALLAISACQRERAGPEAQVRALIQGAISAAEQKRIGELRALISEQYRDDQGQDKRAVENLLRLHFLRDERLHLFARVQSITLAPPGRTQAIVFVAMAGVPIASAQDLPALRVDLHRFEIDFAYEDKQWRAVRAAWRRAEASEFLSLSESLSLELSLRAKRGNLQPLPLEIASLRSQCQS